MILETELEAYGSWVERYEMCYRKVQRKLLCKSIPTIVNLLHCMTEL